MILSSSTPVSYTHLDVYKRQEETTAQENDHFIIERSELPADSIKGILKVKVKKTPELENHNLVATFRLCGNENFAAAPVNENTYKIVLTNHLTEPAGWPFGEYSRIKHQFVIQTLGIATDYDKWSTSESIYYTGIMAVSYTHLPSVLQFL